MARKRRHFSPEDKIAIVRKHLVERIPVSEVCREHDLSPNLFYGWQRELFENGHFAFQLKKKNRVLTKLEAENAKLREGSVSTPPHWSTTDTKLEAENAKLREKLEKKNEVVAELMQEYIQLKKDLGEL